jgi:hypothetical protein
VSAQRGEQKFLEPGEGAMRERLDAAGWTTVSEDASGAVLRRAP